LGIPVVKKYKYLGLWLNSKLSLDDQLEHIRKKSKFIKAKLSPVLSTTSLDYRKNLWALFIRPLFEFTLPLHKIEVACSRKEELRRLLKFTFKSFTRISKTTPDRIVYKLCGYNIDERAEENHKIQGQKWTERCQNWEMTAKKSENGLQQEELEMESAEKEEDLCKGIPAIGVELINTLTMLCPKCESTKIMNAEHLKELHGLMVPDPIEMFREVQKLQNSDEGKGTRAYKMWKAYQMIKVVVDKLRGFTNHGDI